jgi:hypothetical protein
MLYRNYYCHPARQYKTLAILVKMNFFHSKILGSAFYVKLLTHLNGVEGQMGGSPYAMRAEYAMENVKRKLNVLQRKA